MIRKSPEFVAILIIFLNRLYDKFKFCINMRTMDWIGNRIKVVDHTWIMGKVLLFSEFSF